MTNGRLKLVDDKRPTKNGQRKMAYDIWHMKYDQYIMADEKRQMKFTHKMKNKLFSSFSSFFSLIL